VEAIAQLRDLSPEELNETEAESSSWGGRPQKGQEKEDERISVAGGWGKKHISELPRNNSRGNKEFNEKASVVDNASKGKGDGNSLVKQSLSLIERERKGMQLRDNAIDGVPSSRGDRLLREDGSYINLGGPNRYQTTKRKGGTRRPLV